MGYTTVTCTTLAFAISSVIGPTEDLTLPFWDIVIWHFFLAVHASELLPLLMFCQDIFLSSNMCVDDKSCKNDFPHWAQIWQMGAWSGFIPDDTIGWQDLSSMRLTVMCHTCHCGAGT